MALSWIFKKREEKPVPVTVEAVEVGSDEDYAIIQSKGTGMYPQVPVSPYPYMPLPYTLQPTQNDHKLKSNTRTISVYNQLEGVPFVLSSILDRSSDQNVVAGLEDIRRIVFQIAADINDSVFEYNFKLEQSILREASIYNGKN